MTRPDRKRGLTGRQRQALHLLRRCADHDDGWGVVYAGTNHTYDGQAWIHWRTAEALQARGLVEIDRSMGREGTRLRERTEDVA